MKNLGEVFKTERDARHLTLREVSVGVKIDQSLISKFEKNERKPTREQVIKLAEYYGLSSSELLNNWYSDKIVDDLMYCTHPEEILKIAEEKIEYLRKVQNGK